MNKQAFTFLTLFTLVLLLGVYYVTLPADSVEFQMDDLIASAEKSVFEQYEDVKQQLTEELKSKNEQVISSSSTSSEEKLEALENNAVLDAAVQFEALVQQMLKEKGIETSFVEKNDDIVRIVLPKTENEQLTALQLMRWVDEISDEHVLVEVSFE
ncbi:MAG: hypothetical protein E7192_06185 [Erysipelotrichaceae bacterium]|nr:hypothetical protein [Erysipelotrichaceae bacterium]